MKRALLLSLMIASPAMAHDVTETGRYTCTSDEGWKYYYEIHSIESSEMIYSRGHDNVLSGWETTCFGKGFPVFEYCRDMERVPDGAPSKPHERLRKDCASKAAEWREKVRKDGAAE